MTDVNELVQRFVDQELSAEERIRFVVRLGRDEALRQDVLALEELVDRAGRLPRPAVPAGFVANVMERTAPPRPTMWSLMKDALLAPRSFEWNLAGAVAMVCLALVIVWSARASGILSGLREPDAAVATIAADPAASTPVLVRLVVVRSGARTVQVAGDFNGWNPSDTPLDRIGDDAWAVTIRVEPGRYEYMFVVDGEWVADPFAAEHSDDGFGSRNAVLDVGLEAGRL